MIRALTLFSLGSVALSILGCSGEAALSDAELTEIGDGSRLADLDTQEKDAQFWYNSGSIWGSEPLTVCWDGGGGTERQWVREAIEREFEGRFGIDFVRWTGCGVNDYPSIRIRVGDTEWPRATVGKSTTNAIWPANMFLNFFNGSPRDLGNGTSADPDFPSCWSGIEGGQAPFVDVTGRVWESRRRYCIEGIAIHEFAHTLGVSHEQNSSLNPNPVACKPDASSNGDTAYGYWDALSISDYCNPMWTGGAHLSTLDISGFARLYGSDTDDQVWYGQGDARQFSDHRYYVPPGQAALYFDVKNQLVGGMYRPFSGDFDGDGKDDIFFHSEEAGDQIFWAEEGRTFTQADIVMDAAKYSPAKGDFNGDGIDDVLWYDLVTGASNVWYGRGDRRFDEYGSMGLPPALPGNGAYRPYAGDFDGDGNSDVYWYAVVGGTERIWYGSSSHTFTSVSHSQTSGYTPYVGDYDNDGRDDIFWHRPGTLSDAISFATMTRGQFIKRTIQADQSGPAAVVDFDGNGTSDVVWSNSSSETDEVWLFEVSSGATTSTPVSSTMGNSIAAGIPIVGDFDGNNRGDVFWYSPGARLVAGAVESIQQGLTYERWNNVDGMSVAEIPLDSPPSIVEVVPRSEIFPFTGDYYGVRLRGYVTAPTTGQYAFAIAGDDNVELSLSTNEDPANKQRIAYHTSWTQQGEWSAFPSQRSAQIQLEAGQRYYIEALMKEAWGGDHLSVSWQAPGQSLLGVIPTNVLSPMAAACRTNQDCRGSGMPTCVQPLCTAQLSCEYINRCEPTRQ